MFKSRWPQYVIPIIIIVLILLVGGWLCVNITDYCVSTYTRFKGYGEVGDAIGGTVTPIVTFIALLVAAAAFIVQYIALIKQKEQMLQNYVDNRFYSMLDVYNRNCESLKAGDIVGKAAAQELSGEFYYTYCIVNDVYNRFFEHYVSSTEIDPVFISQINILIKELNNDLDKKRTFLTKVAYGLFYEGIHYTYPYNDKTKVYFNLVELLKDKLKNYIFVKGQGHYDDVLKSDTIKISPHSYSFQYELFGGHNETLGCYYRQLFQIVDYISKIDPKILSEEEKYNHIKILRAQLSEYEQFLLFYNSLSDYGEIWNQKQEFKKGRINYKMGYIARYKLIKNIPSNIYWRGIIPIDYFKEEMSFYNELNSTFFERPQLMQAD